MSGGGQQQGGGGIIVHSQTRSGANMHRRTELSASELAELIDALPDGELKAKLAEILADLP